MHDTTAAEQGFEPPTRGSVGTLPKPDDIDLVCSIPERPDGQFLRDVRHDRLPPSEVGEDLFGHLFEEGEGGGGAHAGEGSEVEG